MSEDCLLTFSAHGRPLTAECLDAKIGEKAFNIQTARKLRVPRESLSQWSNIAHIYLHNLVRLAAEVLGAQAEEEVG